MPRLPSTTAHSIPAGPAPTTSTSLSAFSAGANFSGCQPRRYSSPAVAFWVQMIERPLVCSGETQTLQPMHSRMSSSRPSSIFFGRNGSAIEGRAAPMMSSWPRVDRPRPSVSGLVKRPTPTIGFFVAGRTFAIQVALVVLAGRSATEPASSPHSSDDAADLEVPEVDQVVGELDEPATSSSVLELGSAVTERVDAKTRTAIAQSSPTASAHLARASRAQKRARFSNEPPYSSVRLL